jgi:hypothetical protein
LNLNPKLSLRLRLSVGICPPYDLPVGIAHPTFLLFDSTDYLSARLRQRSLH